MCGRSPNSFPAKNEQNWVYTYTDDKLIIEPRWRELGSLLYIPRQSNLHKVCQFGQLHIANRALLTWTKSASLAST